MMSVLPKRKRLSIEKVHYLHFRQRVLYVFLISVTNQNQQVGDVCVLAEASLNNPMREYHRLLIHLLVTLAKLCKPGGVKAVMAKTMAMKQQLIVLNRGRARAPKLATSERFLLGLLAYFFLMKTVLKRWPSLSNLPPLLTFTKLW